MYWLLYLSFNSMHLHRVEIIPIKQYCVPCTVYPSAGMKNTAMVWIWKMNKQNKLFEKSNIWKKGFFSIVHTVFINCNRDEELWIVLHSQLNIDKVHTCLIVNFRLLIVRSNILSVRYLLLSTLCRKMTFPQKLIFSAPINICGKNIRFWTRQQCGERVL